MTAAGQPPAARPDGTDGLPQSPLSAPLRGGPGPPVTGRSDFVGEADAYALLARAGFTPPRHGLVGDPLPFAPGEAVVLKGLGENLWHKSELGAVHFGPFDAGAIATESGAIRQRVEAAGHRWIAGLVCERIDVARRDGLPGEGFVSLSRGEAGWMILCGFGGLQADALAELAPPLCWPAEFVSPEEAANEFERHLLGRTWLGRLRGTRPVTTVEHVRAFFFELWQLVRLAEADGVSLLELNPFVADQSGRLRPLDAVGRREAPPPARCPPAGELLEALRHPRRVALAGVSSHEGGVGRTILENLRRYRLPPGDLLVIKPGADTFLGLPAVPDVRTLRPAPVDLLILALPAQAAAETLLQLIAQGGGAAMVALVAGGIGDGADTAGLGKRLSGALREARAAGRWTPSVLGPNFLGHWSPPAQLDTSFIPAAKLPPPPAAGSELTLLSQSGAFLLCRRSAQPGLRFGLGVALGNQMDVALCDLLAELAVAPSPGAVAAYVEGFPPGQLLPTARAVRQLTTRGGRVLLHRGGRTEAGQAAAASHTGAMAGNLKLEEALLVRAGARIAASITEFDDALTWLSAYPRLQAGPVALVTNAGFESVNGSDALSAGLTACCIGKDALSRLLAVLERHHLDGLVTPRLPLDLTPMAGESAFLAVCDLLLGTEAGVVVVGLVPFTRQLETEGPGPAKLASALAQLSRAHGKPVAVAVDAGADYDSYRRAFGCEGLAVFQKVESALVGLRVLVGVRPA